ncbi:tryptophan halogenase family protein [Candidatus Colwellia aromaticivorans]|uniref:tryptophan halogenase family protein n=1 Tax=Candidatus Colwellia aromaticivorans TaxID=2267621 RepID=UPI000DF41611|nr:tryptophan halogenase family protein [Candidatus Colwellia aromaticivorans]
MTEQVIKQVIIVGGGTAGWLTAAKLAKRFNSTDPSAIQVTLIESPDIPTIGVGEGTWPTMRKTLAELGISETVFLKRCNASFKQATKFVNWKQAPQNGINNHYYHLFTSMFDSNEFNLAPYWNLGDIGQNESYADSISVQATICELGLAPKLITNKEFEGIQNYAYHLDAGLFTDLLREHATSTLGVKHISANVTDVNLDVDGYIASINTDKAGVITGGFFVDCTGFKSLLIGEALGIPFKKVNDTLLTDHALAIQVPYETDNPIIASSTISTAQEAGWTWDIALANRRGTGYVYSSAHTSHDRAEQILREYIGPQAAQLDARLIKMNVGYREKFWHKNCFAVGLSAAFVEPLEASAIFLIEASGNMLSELFPRDRASMELVEKQVNKSFKFRWNKTIDFIKMHYYLSKRDEPFWQDNKNLNTVPDSLLELLARWKHQLISNYDFDNVYEPFPLDSYQYVLYGMGFEQDLSFNKSAFNKQDIAKQHYAKVKAVTEQIKNQLPSNQELLKKVSQYGFHKL